MFAREYELFFSTLKLKSETWRVTTVSGEKQFTESFPKLSQVLTRTNQTKYSDISCGVLVGERLGSTDASFPPLYLIPFNFPFSLLLTFCSEKYF